MNRLTALLAIALPVACAQASPRPALVAVPVADVWSEPAVSSASLTSDKRETQVLFGERVLIQESSGAWTRIEATAQSEYTHHNRWEGYPGWVLSKDLIPFQGQPGSREAIVSVAAGMQGA